MPFIMSRARGSLVAVEEKLLQGAKQEKGRALLKRAWHLIAQTPPGSLRESLAKLWRARCRWQARIGGNARAGDEQHAPGAGQLGGEFVDGGQKRSRQVRRHGGRGKNCFAQISPGEGKRANVIFGCFLAFFCCGSASHRM
jgi:hypothetical protein